MNKKQLSERDICMKYITPALEKAGWDVVTQIREEYSLTKERIIVRGKLHTRAQHKRADYVLFYKPNIPIAVIEAKDNNLRDFSLRFDGASFIDLFVGKNGTGKSNLFAALNEIFRHIVEYDRNKAACDFNYRFEFIRSKRPVDAKAEGVAP